MSRCSYLLFYLFEQPLIDILHFCPSINEAVYNKILMNLIQVINNRLFLGKSPFNVGNGDLRTGLVIVVVPFIVFKVDVLELGVAFSTRALELTVSLEAHKVDTSRVNLEHLDCLATVVNGVRVLHSGDIDRRSLAAHAALEHKVSFATGSGDFVLFVEVDGDVVRVDLSALSAADGESVEIGVFDGVSESEVSDAFQIGFEGECNHFRVLRCALV